MNFQQKMTPSSEGRDNEFGFECEDHFFRAMESLIESGEHPDWFMGVRKAKKHQDQLGIDGIATIRYQNGKIGRIPFQIKAGKVLIEKHQHQRLVFWMDDLRYLVIHLDMSDDEMYDQFFEVMKNVRRRNERFDRILRYLRTGKYISPYEERMVRKNP